MHRIKYHAVHQQRDKTCRDYSRSSRERYHHRCMRFFQFIEQASTDRNDWSSECTLHYEAPKLKPGHKLLCVERFIPISCCCYKQCCSHSMASIKAYDSCSLVCVIWVDVLQDHPDRWVTYVSEIMQLKYRRTRGISELMHSIIVSHQDEADVSINEEHV